MVLGPSPMSLGHLGSEGQFHPSWPGIEAKSSLLDYVAQDLCLLTHAGGHGLGFLALC